MNFVARAMVLVLHHVGIGESRFLEPERGQVVVLEDRIETGGRHQQLIEKIGKNLLDAGFAVARHNDPDLQGTNVANICNRGGEAFSLEL